MPRFLRIGSPWQVEAVHLRLHAREVHIVVGLVRGNTLRCLLCDQACPGYDTRPRRHLDTCQYRTIVVADVPRVQCPEHGVRQIAVPRAEPGSRFTALV
jgi:transposase